MDTARLRYPGPSFLTILAMAVGLWALLLFGFAYMWPARQDGSKIGSEREHVPQLARLPASPRFKASPDRKANAAKRKRTRTSLSARVFKSRQTF